MSRLSRVFEKDGGFDLPTVVTVALFFAALVVLLA